MNYVRYFLIIILIILALAGARLAVRDNDAQQNVQTLSGDHFAYSSDTFKISFAYPRKYYEELLKSVIFKD